MSAFYCPATKMMCMGPPPCETCKPKPELKLVPAEPAASTMHLHLDFGRALRHLRAGNRVARQGWNGKGMWLGLQIPDATSKMTLPYIYMKTADDQLVPWLASQTDLLALDWVVLEGK